MRWSDISFHPTPRTLRQFAGLWITFFGLLALSAWWRGHESTAIVCGVLAITIGPTGLLFPQFVKPIFVAWMVAAFPIGWVVSHVLLALVFYGLFTPLGLFFRCIGRDALMRRRPGDQATYWLPKQMPSDVRRYFRQF